MVDTLSLIVSILCAVGSFISFLLAQKEKKEAKESERQTQIYAENAIRQTWQLKSFTMSFLNISSTNMPLTLK